MSFFCSLVAVCHVNAADNTSTSLHISLHYEINKLDVSDNQLKMCKNALEKKVCTEYKLDQFVSDGTNDGFKHELENNIKKPQTAQEYQDAYDKNKCSEVQEELNTFFKKLTNEIYKK